ncbi:hypothetical protein SNOG_06823 [Parastagonospora nodorum SN15]|uniref:Uncharacterized protein n=1 Tax=Phaeosphaeria nodorum (strain SN15 / ATCC MYA-4574 / FGSC 10173) TaxID=321614 RepID=Q0UN41_PHANO|nr:hypothetical protein SNOG_06823 [Parastagonospora nodorum SN15]EAT85474.1 hypothetical protein SNOG_06823 [Parastagonospora nodorum SN15]
MNSAQARAHHEANQSASSTFDVVTEWSSTEAGMIFNAYLVVFPNPKSLSECEIMVSLRWG